MRNPVQQDNHDISNFLFANSKLVNLNKIDDFTDKTD